MHPEPESDRRDPSWMVPVLLMASLAVFVALVSALLIPWMSCPRCEGNRHGFRMGVSVPEDWPEPLKQMPRPELLDRMIRNCGVCAGKERMSPLARWKLHRELE